MLSKTNSLLRQKNIKEVIIKQKERRMVKNGEDYDGLRSTNLKNLP